MRVNTTNVIRTMTLAKILKRVETVVSGKSQDNLEEPEELGLEEHSDGSKLIESQPKAISRQLKEINPVQEPPPQQSQLANGEDQTNLSQGKI